MEITLLDKNDKKGTASLLIKNSTPAYVNALRRAVIERVPTMAIKEVEFIKNNSVLYDEIIAHRLGLTCLKTDLKSYKLPEDGEEVPDSAEYRVRLNLKAKGPCVVTAGMMKSEDPKIKPVFPKTPITKLIEGQELEFVAVATLGLGVKHAKWAPGSAWYRYKPTVEIIKPFTEEEAKAINEGPLKLFDIKNKKVTLNKDYLLSLELTEAIAHSYPENIKITNSNKDFIFEIESWGQLPAKEVLTKAIEYLSESSDTFGKLLKKA